jgi:hypothetical protein
MSLALRVWQSLGLLVARQVDLRFGLRYMAIIEKGKALLSEPVCLKTVYRHELVNLSTRTGHFSLVLEPFGWRDVTRCVSGDELKEIDDYSEFVEASRRASWFKGAWSN